MTYKELDDLKRQYSEGFQEGTVDREHAILDNIRMQQAHGGGYDRVTIAYARGYHDAHVSKEEQFGGPLGKYFYVAEAAADDRARIVRVHTNGKRVHVAEIRCESIPDEMGTIWLFGYGKYTIASADEDNLIPPFNYTIIADNIVESVDKLSEKCPELRETTLNPIAPCLCFPEYPVKVA